MIKFYTQIIQILIFSCHYEKLNLGLTDEIIFRQQIFIPFIEIIKYTVQKKLKQMISRIQRQIKSALIEEQNIFRFTEANSEKQIQDKQSQQKKIRKQKLKELIVYGIFKRFCNNAEQKINKMVTENNKDQEVINSSEKNIFLKNFMKKRTLNSKIVEKQYYTTIDPQSYKLKQLRQFQLISNDIIKLIQKKNIKDQIKKNQRKSKKKYSSYISRHSSLSCKSNLLKQLFLSKQKQKQFVKILNDVNENQILTKKSKKKSLKLINDKSNQENQFFDFNLINKNLNSVIKNNADYKVIVIKNMLNSLLEKSSALRADLSSSQKYFSSFQNSKFDNVYTSLNTINQYISEINQILLKHVKLQVRQIRKQKKMNFNKSRQRLKRLGIFNTRELSQKISINIMITGFKRVLSELVKISQRYLSHDQNRIKIINQDYQKLITTIMKARYNLGFLHKQMKFLNNRIKSHLISLNKTLTQSLSSSIQKPKTLKKDKTLAQISQVAKILKSKYKVSTNFNPDLRRSQFIFPTPITDYPIADHREWIRAKAYNNPYNQESIYLLKKHKGINPINDQQ